MYDATKFAYYQITIITSTSQAVPFDVPLKKCKREENNQKVM